MPLMFEERGVVIVFEKRVLEAAIGDVARQEFRSNDRTRRENYSALDRVLKFADVASRIPPTSVCCSPPLELSGETPPFQMATSLWRGLPRARHPRGSGRKFRHLSAG